MLEHERLVNPEILPPPSPEFAYWLGFMSGAGHIHLKVNAISYSKVDEKAIGIYSEITQNLFGIEGKTTYTPRKGKQGLHHVFFSTKLVKKIGDLSRENWQDTIEKWHPWVHVNDDTRLAFVNGYFDSNGSITPTPSSRDIHYRVTLSSFTPQGCRALLKFVEACGFAAKTKNSPSSSQGVSGVVIENKEQVIEFAKIMSSKFVDKEALLQGFREMETRDMQGAYKFVMKLYRQGLQDEKPLGAKRLIKHPIVQASFPWLSPSTVHNWIHDGITPRKDNIYNLMQLLYLGHISEFRKYYKEEDIKMLQGYLNQIAAQLDAQGILTKEKIEEIMFGFGELAAMRWPDYFIKLQTTMRAYKKVK